MWIQLLVLTCYSANILFKRLNSITLIQLTASLEPSNSVVFSSSFKIPFTHYFTAFPGLSGFCRLFENLTDVNTAKGTNLQI